MSQAFPAPGEGYAHLFRSQALYKTKLISFEFISAVL